MIKMQDQKEHILLFYSDQNAVQEKNYTKSMEKMY